MVSNVDKHDVAKTDTTTWQLNALTEALGDLTLTVSDSLSIGRGTDNDVVLGSKSVSRNHALLSVLNGELYIKDLDSSNGTFINEKRIEGNKSEPLDADDTVTFASFAFQVIAPSKEVIASTEGNIAPTEDVVTSTPTPKEGNVGLDPVTAPVASTQPDIEPTDREAAQLSNKENEIVAVKEDETVETMAPAMATTPVVTAEATPEQPTVMETDKTVDPEVTNTSDEPVVKETIVEDVLSSAGSETESPAAAVVEPVEPLMTEKTVPSMAAEKETMMSKDTSKETLNKEPVVNTPVVDEPLAKEPTTPQQPKPIVTSDEHDKTTKTTLQEEADPDVLRAKQAATAQFSGTANLGQARDLGTEGNNAMDQAIDNPANAGYVEKKPSGGWFIWVFIVVIIIGIALWLFNMGGA